MKMVLLQKSQIKNYKHYHRDGLQSVMGHLQRRNPDGGLTREMVQGQEDWGRMGRRRRRREEKVCRQRSAMREEQEQGSWKRKTRPRGKIQL